VTPLSITICFCTISRDAYQNCLPKLSYRYVDVPNPVCDRIKFGPWFSCILGGGGRKSFEVILLFFSFSCHSIHVSSGSSCCLGWVFFIHFPSFCISPARFHTVTLGWWMVSPNTPPVQFYWVFSDVLLAD